jgi:putative transposase
MQLIAGMTAQEYNQRKTRKGAFWEDRYHATAVESDSHLIQCMVYIDMNMVRAGAVEHPSEWPFSGYSEIQEPRQRYALIDYNNLMDLLNIQNRKDLGTYYRNWVNESLEAQNHTRDSRWTESVAVGSKEFVEKTKEELGIKVRGRSVIETRGFYELREPETPYAADLTLENASLRPQNTYYWDILD